MTSRGIPCMSNTDQTKISTFWFKMSSSRFQVPLDRRAPIYTIFTGKSLSEHESGCSVNSPRFLGSFWSCCSVGCTSLAFYILGAIMKHCRAICWFPRISPTPFLVRNRTKDAWLRQLHPVFSILVI